MDIRKGSHPLHCRSRNPGVTLWAPGCFPWATVGPPAQDSRPKLVPLGEVGAGHPRGTAPASSAHRFSCPSYCRECLSELGGWTQKYSHFLNSILCSRGPLPSHRGVAGTGAQPSPSPPWCPSTSSLPHLPRTYPNTHTLTQVPQPPGAPQTLT